MVRRPAAQLGLMALWVAMLTLGSGLWCSSATSRASPRRPDGARRRVRGCRKAFVLRTNRQYLLKERALGMIRPQLREAAERSGRCTDVGFAVHSGEMFGMIGPNGAGKTTLFRIIAGIFQPTTGSIRTSGRVAPLLGLGVGFHPEMTGRENIYLGAAIFGFTTREIRALESTSSRSPSSGGSSTWRSRTTHRGCRSGSDSRSRSRSSRTSS